MEKTKIICVVGATASGKSALGIEIAKAIGGEIISADSMQVYKYMPVATAVVTEEEAQGIPHHLVEYKEPDEVFSVADFVSQARIKIDEICKRGNVPIIVGGTGLFVDSLVKNIEFSDVGVDNELRREYEKYSNEELYSMLRVADEKAAELVDEFKRILKPTGNIFIFCSYNIIGEYHKAFDSEFDTFQFMVWHKTNPVPNFRKSSFLNSCELIVACWNKGHTWNFTNQRDMHNFIESGICMGSERIKDKNGKNLHPTQKPVSILKKIINIASNENDVVLDCFNGVGSTGEAALNLKRRYIGIEIDKEYYDATEKRLNHYRKIRRIKNA